MELQKKYPQYSPFYQTVLQLLYDKTARDAALRGGYVGWTSNKGYHVIMPGDYNYDYNKAEEWAAREAYLISTAGVTALSSTGRLVQEKIIAGDASYWEMVNYLFGTFP